MAFDSMRKDRPSQGSNCRFCDKVVKDGTVVLAVKDNDAKTIISRNVRACETCAIEQYERLLAELMGATVEPGSASTVSKGGK